MSLKGPWDDDYVAPEPKLGTPQKAPEVGIPTTKKPVKKTKVSIYLDNDLVEYLRGTGRFWQTRVNDLLRKEMK